MVEAQVERSEHRVLREGVSDRLGAGGADVVVDDGQTAELAVVVEELADRAGAAVRDDVVGQVEFEEDRVVEDVGDEDAHLKKYDSSGGRFD